MPPSNFTKYCACHAKWVSWLIRLAYERSLEMRGAARVTFQLHQILRLPRKMSLLIDPANIWNIIYNARSNRTHPPTSPNTAPATQNDCHDAVMIDRAHIWNVIYNARSNRHHPPTSPNTAPATQNDCHDWLCSHETSVTMRGATKVTLQSHQVLRLPRNSEFKISATNLWSASAKRKTIGT